MSSPITLEAARDDDAMSNTPSSRRAASPTPLTPRSKVRAMLAAIDDADSDGESGDPNRYALTLGSDRNEASSGPTRAKHRDYEEDKVTEDSDTEGIDDGAQPRPRGKLASRMLADSRQQLAKPKERDTPPDDNGAVYERVKRRLTQAQASTLMANKSRQASPDESDSEDHEVLHPIKANRDRRVRTSTSLDDDIPLTTFNEAGIESPGSSESSVAEVLKRPWDNSVNHSDSDLPENPHSDPRTLALAESERQERRAKEEQATLKRKEREARLQELSKARKYLHNAPATDSDSADERRLTQQARPTRKASKKALEEMNRETQRISRNMHLAHEARTKKRITKESLFARFNFKPTDSKPTDSGVGAAGMSATAPHSSSTLLSEGDAHYSTAPSSPPLLASSFEKANEDVGKSGAGPSRVGGTAQQHDQDIPTPARDTVPEHRGLESSEEPPTWKSQIRLGKLDDREDEATRAEPEKVAKGIRKVIRRDVIKAALSSSRHFDSDSDLEIIPTSRAKAALVEHVQQSKETQSRPLHAQRTLARLNVQEDGLNRNKGSITPLEMHVVLQRRARQQAAKAREEHLDDLRRKGVILQTAEERAKDNATIEEMLEKARKETEEMAKREKAAAKKAGSYNAESYILDSDSENEDADWGEEEDNVEWSGSEEENEDDDDELQTGEDEDEEPEAVEDTTMIGDSNGDHRSTQHSISVSEAPEQSVLERTTVSPIISDTNRVEQGQSAVLSRDKATNVGLRSNHEQDPPSSATVRIPCSTKKPLNPGLPSMEPVSFGLTQLFAGTMADCQTQHSDAVPRTQIQAEKQDSLDFLRHLPAISLPCIEQGLDRNLEERIVDSQPLQSQTSQSEGDLPLSQNDSLSVTFPSGTQFSEFPDPTQDVGFAPARPLISHATQGCPSTVDTVLADKDGVAASGNDARLEMEDGRPGSEDDLRGLGMDVEDEGDAESSPTAFDVMRKVGKKKALQERFDKKKSRAKEMFEEQAEESEDEYAGLGGASDDDSVDDKDEEAAVNDILDDTAADVDEADLAALAADKDRAEDKKQIEKIYRDVMTGGLRKRRGTELDLSDSDDDEEARRRMKRRKEMKLRKALLADEHIEKIATNPKKSAFFQSIEDRDKADTLDFLDEPLVVDVVPDSQPAAPSSMLESAPLNKRKRSRQAAASDENRLPPTLRRPGIATQKPSSLSEIRECLTTLMAPPNAIMVPADAAHVTDDDDEDDDDIESPSDAENHTKARRDAFIHSRRRATATTTASSKIIDRLALQRHNTVANDHHTTTTHLAFHTTDTQIRLPPTLLRRATTSSSSSHLFPVSSTTPTTTSADTQTRRRPTAKSSCSINWYTREVERKNALEARKARDTMMHRRRLGRSGAAGDERENRRCALREVVSGRFE